MVLLGFFIWSAIVAPALGLTQESSDDQLSIHQKCEQQQGGLMLLLPEEEKEEEERDNDKQPWGVDFKFTKNYQALAWCDGPTAWAFNHCNSLALGVIPVYLTTHNFLI